MKKYAPPYVSYSTGGAAFGFPWNLRSSDFILSRGDSGLTGETP